MRLDDPVQQEAQALVRLGELLRDRVSTSVRLAPVVQEVRARSQRRVELGAILLGALEAPCDASGRDDGRAATLLDAQSFDWSDLERGALLTFGCAAGAPGAGGAIQVHHALFLRGRGRWQVVRRIPGAPDGWQAVRLHDFTLDGNPEVWSETRTGDVGRVEIVGWRDSKVASMLELRYRARCAPAGPQRWTHARPVIADPGDRGKPGLVLERTILAAPCSGSPGPPPTQRQQEVWRYNARLSRFYRRVTAVAPEGATPLAVPPPGEAASDVDAPAAPPPPPPPRPPGPGAPQTPAPKASPDPGAPSPAVIEPALAPDTTFD